MSDSPRLGTWSSVLARISELVAIEEAAREFKAFLRARQVKSASVSRSVILTALGTTGNRREGRLSDRYCSEMRKLSDPRQSAAPKGPYQGPRKGNDAMTHYSRRIEGFWRSRFAAR